MIISLKKRYADPSLVNSCRACIPFQRENVTMASYHHQQIMPCDKSGGSTDHPRRVPSRSTSIEANAASVSVNDGGNRPGADIVLTERMRAIKRATTGHSRRECPGNRAGQPEAAPKAGGVYGGRLTQTVYCAVGKRSNGRKETVPRKAVGVSCGEPLLTLPLVEAR